jgi:hypothetical protein
MAQPQMSEFCHRFSWYMCLFIRSQLEVSAPMEPGGGENASRHVAIRSRSRSQWQDMSSQAVAKLVSGVRVRR